MTNALFNILVPSGRPTYARLRRSPNPDSPSLSQVQLDPFQVLRNVNRPVHARLAILLGERRAAPPARRAPDTSSSAAREKPDSHRMISPASACADIESMRSIVRRDGHDLSVAS